MWKVGQNSPFFKCAILKFDFFLKFDFQKRKQLRFSEVNYLNYTKRPNFACDNYIFPKNKGKQEQAVYPFHGR